MQNDVNKELDRLQHWNRSDQLALLEGLAAIIRRQDSVKPQRHHKARDFRGVGRETWKDIDVEEYIRQERASWDD